MVLAIGAMTVSEAAEASVGVDAASAYVFRGATFNDGFVLQPYLEVSGPVTIGVWGNLDIDDYDGAVNDGEFQEIDLYAAYDLPMPESSPFGLSIGYCEYTYPSSVGDGSVTTNDTDSAADREISLSLGLDTVLSPSLGLYYGVDGAIDKSLHAELSAGHDIEIGDGVTLSLGATIAYEDPDEGEDGFSYYSASAGLGFGCLSASVTYVGQIDDDVLVDVEDGGVYDVDVYGMIGVSQTF